MAKYYSNGFVVIESMAVNSMKVRLNVLLFNTLVNFYFVFVCYIKWVLIFPLLCVHIRSIQNLYWIYLHSNHLTLNWLWKSYGLHIIFRKLQYARYVLTFYYWIEMYNILVVFLFNNLLDLIWNIYSTIFNVISKSNLNSCLAL